MSDETIDALAATGYALYSATLVGNPCEFVRKLGAWMRAVEVGHLVMEQTTAFHPGSKSDRIGELVKTEQRRSCRHEQADPNLTHCETCDDDNRWLETYWWIRTFDGRSHRWHNASFIRIPRSQDDWRSVRYP